MKRIPILILLCLLTAAAFAQPPRQLYELRTYELRFGGSRAALEDYFKNALLPTLNRYGIRNIGAFAETSQNDPAKLYILIPYDTMDGFATTFTRMQNDPQYLALSKNYDMIERDKAVFTRYTTSLLLAFAGFPQIQPLKPGQKLIEMRIYESQSESANRNKVAMFNDEELEIFRKTNLHGVFFGQNIAGDYLPCLTYMLAFDSMQERDANWKDFVNHPDWKRISTDPKYAQNMTNIRRVFLTPLSYSQL